MNQAQRFPPSPFLLTCALLAPAATTHAQQSAAPDAEACVAIVSDADRLACYDAAMKRSATDPGAADKAAMEAKATKETIEQYKRLEREALPPKERTRRVVSDLFKSEAGSVFDVRLASKAEWGPLLQAGVEISEYQPTMLHTKLLVVDNEMVSVGSTNFDIRSFQLNDEASLNIYDRGFAEAMTRVFEADLRQGRKYTYKTWQQRPLKEKLVEKFVLPIKSQL